ncbi:MAG: hypothetical protein ACK51M_22075 [Burkholderiales bacterium]
MPQTGVVGPHETIRAALSGRFPSTAGVTAEGTRPGPADVVARGAPADRPSPAVREMMRRLPGNLLRRTAADFPHMLEAIARDWATPDRFHAMLDAFVFDDRGGRAGFPPEVLLELAELRTCHERWVGPRTTLGR